ncbi:SAVED domain-containing protein, partial [Nesterenkonia sphaerica]
GELVLLEANGHMGRRNTRVARVDIPASVIREIWARAAGRCVLCSAYLLGTGRSFFHTAHGEIAHNVGATQGKKSPRGASKLSLEERSKAENLLLLCHQCHRMIDAAGAEEVYTDEYLRERKQVFEDHVRRVTDFATVTETAVVRVTGRVRGTFAPATDRQVSSALHLEGMRYAGEHPRDAEFVVSIDSEDTDSWVWQEGMKKIVTKLSALRDTPFDTVSVFAMAPVPLLVFLGSKLEDKGDIRVFPRFRDAEDLAWCWRSRPGSCATFAVASSGASATATEVVLTVNVSGVVDLGAAPADFAALPRVTLAADAPGPDAIQTKADLAAFSRAWRSALARVEMDYPLCERIHMLAAVPVVAAVACGQHYMRGAQPALVVYQRAREGYIEALTL